MSVNTVVQYYLDSWRIWQKSSDMMFKLYFPEPMIAFVGVLMDKGKTVLQLSSEAGQW